MRFAIVFVATMFFALCAQAQLGQHPDFNPNPPTAPALLPPNYQTILDNSDVLIMHVHYGAHETVPVHDHPAVATMFIYLNDSGPVDIIHEGRNAVIAHRPPTHIGDFRIGPGIAEQHSIVSQSNTGSDLLRVEFKNVTFPNLPEAGKHFSAPDPPTLGVVTEFQNASITVSRVVCSAGRSCDLPAPSQRALLIPLTSTAIAQSNIESSEVASGMPMWLPGSKDSSYSLRKGSQALLISFSDAAASKLPCKF